MKDSCHQRYQNRQEQQQKKQHNSALMDRLSSIDCQLLSDTVKVANKPRKIANRLCKTKCEEFDTQPTPNYEVITGSTTIPSLVGSSLQNSLNFQNDSSDDGAFFNNISIIENEKDTGKSSNEVICKDKENSRSHYLYPFHQQAYLWNLFSPLFIIGFLCIPLHFFIECRPHSMSFELSWDVLPVLLYVLVILSSACAVFIKYESSHDLFFHGISGAKGASMKDTVNYLNEIASNESESENSAQMPTLKEYLSHPDGFHIAFAPAFFGFFAYFGALAAMEEETNGLIVPSISHENSDDKSSSRVTCGLKSVAGASAGAMAAVMLAAGIQPQKAAEFASTFTWRMVADPPGMGGFVKGDRFEEIMRIFLLNVSPLNRYVPSDTGGPSIQLEDALIPVAVSGFDITRMRGRILTRGCMAKAARASAGFPGLFQPVFWRRNCFNNAADGSLLSTVKSWFPDFILVDGGIQDRFGLKGLCHSSSSTNKTKKRVINMIVGEFGVRGPCGIIDMPKGLNIESLVSIAIVNTPLCGPWAMENGPKAVKSAKNAMTAVLNSPMKKGKSNNHYILQVDASKWLE